MSCAALSCLSRTTKGGIKNPEFLFHRFPKCPQIREQWIKAVRRGNWEPTKNSRLCSKHFEKSYYIAGLSRRQLKTDAVPTIFEGYTNITLLSENDEKRPLKQWYPVQSLDTNIMPSVKSLTKIKYEPGKRGIRRLAMLNKLFMKNITDLMSTGTISMQVVGKGIEISKVKVASDFKTVNVFWVCKGDISDQQTETLLNTVAGPLRHELSTLRLMGEVPYIVFVKDRAEAQLVDLDRRLAIADYGEEYTPTDIGHLLKSDFTLNTKLSPEMKAKIKQLEDELPVDEEPLPEMTQNVYGLDHMKIMNRLLAARKKTRDAWDNIDADANVISYRVSQDKGSNIDVIKQKKELAEFLLKRQILQNKLHEKLRDERTSLESDEICGEEEYIDEDMYEEDYSEEFEDSFYYDDKEGIVENEKDNR